MHILWLKTELLHPVDKGGKIRTYHMLKALKREHRVTYLTLDDGTAAPDAADKAVEYCDKLMLVPHATSAKFSPKFYAELAQNLVSSLPYFIKKYESAAMRQAIEQRVSKGDIDVVVCDFLNPSINLPDRLPCPSLLFQHNVEAMIWRRHFEVQQQPLKKAYLKGQWEKSVAYEKTACQRFDYVAAVSADDAETMRHDYGVARVSDVPTGVDTDFFKPSGPRSDDTVEPNSLVFTGSMDWLPNEDAICYFTEAILPLIKQQIPDVKLTVVGRNPFPSLVELSQRDPSVVVTGRVDDVRPYMERAAAYVIPLRIGGGTRLKVYEAMAMEMPIVSTTIGAEGLPVADGKELLLADDPASFADAVVRVLREPANARQIGQQAAETVRTRFGWEGVTAEFVKLCAAAQTHFAQPKVFAARA